MLRCGRGRTLSCLACYQIAPTVDPLRRGEKKRTSCFYGLLSLILNIRRWGTSTVRFEGNSAGDLWVSLARCSWEKFFNIPLNQVSLFQPPVHTNSIKYIPSVNEERVARSDPAHIHPLLQLWSKIVNRNELKSIERIKVGRTRTRPCKCVT